LTLSNEVGNDRTYYGRPFLTSPRAHAACTRELARLADEVLRGIAALGGPIRDEKSTVRRSPERCIVQLGPVALTFAWLRGNNESVALGELLVIVWRGAVAPRKDHNPERPSTGPAALGATPLWEQVLAAVGESEATWRWHARGDDDGRYSSIELAARCVSCLHAAYLDGDVAPFPAPDVFKLT
jgi:hypothetical protein